MPRIACSDATFPLLPPEQAVQLVAMLGFPAIDLGLFEQRSQLQPSEVFKNTSGSAARYRRLLDEHGLELADVFLQAAAGHSDYAVNHPDARRRRRAADWFRHTLDFAAACRCRHVTILPGMHFPDERPADSLARAVDELAWRSEAARAAGIVLGVEPHVGSPFMRPKQVARLLSRTPGLTLTLDYTHFVSRGIPEAEIEPLVPHASHFHVRGSRRGRLQASFADNTIDYERLLEAVARSGADRWLVCEYVWIDWQHCNEVDNLSETILWRDFLRGALAGRDDLSGPRTGATS